MSITPTSAPYRPAYIRDSDGLYYRVGGGFDQSSIDATYVKKIGDTMTGTLIINMGAGGLKLKPGTDNSAFIEYYPRTATPNTRSAWVGFDVGSNTFTITNEISGGQIFLSPSASVVLGGTQPVNIPDIVPTQTWHATPKSYVDTKVAKAGDTMTGPLRVTKTWVGNVFGGGTYAGMQAEPVGYGGPAGPAILLGDGGADGHVYMIPRSDGDVFIRPRSDPAKQWQFGDTVTALTPLTLPADPTTPLQAATKQYVDNKAFTPTTRSVIAGTGLTGGGALSADVTLNVIGDANLSVAADVINVLSAPKWTIGRTIQLTGDVTGLSAAWDGSAALSFATTITAGIIVDADINASANIATSKILGLDTALTGKAPTTRAITAGAGLTGTGTLAADITLAVGAGTGITANADDVAINRTTVDTWYLGMGGGTLTGPLITTAPIAGASGIRLPHGTAPTTPTNGDVWTTTAGIYVRINGGTVGPLGSGGGGVTDHAALTGLLNDDHTQYFNTARGDARYSLIAHTHTQAQSHNTPDTDSAPTALHHTLGTGANQAAAGSHTHTAAAVGAEPAGAVATHAATAGHELLSSTLPAALGSAAIGVGTTTARADHVHAMPTAANVGAEASGAVATHDALATAHSALRGTATPVSDDAGTAVVGVANKFAREDHKHSITVAAPVALGAANAAGSATTLARSDHVHIYPTAANVGAEPAGAITTHVGLADPHTQYLLSAGDTMTGQLTSTMAWNANNGNGQIFLNGATGNRIEFQSVGAAVPTFTTRSVGTKIVLQGTIGASTADYAIGLTANAIWQSVPTNSTSYLFRWYGGTTNIASLDGTGSLSLSGVLIPPASVVGSAGLRLLHGTAPSAPVNGDFWTTTAGAYIQINGATVGPLSGGGLSQATADTLYVGKTGNQTMTGTLSAASYSGSNYSVNSANATVANIEFRTNNVLRWTVGKNATNETGASTTGSDFTIAAYTDAGAWLSNPISIIRATGAVTIGAALTVSAASGFLALDRATTAGAAYMSIGTAGTAKWAIGHVDATDTLYIYSAAAAGAMTFDYATGMVSVARDPTSALHVATKQYADGSGAIMNLSFSIPTGTSLSTQIATVVGSVAKWGTVVGQSGGGIIVTVAGWYKITFNGQFPTSGVGTVRLIGTLVGGALPAGMNQIADAKPPSANTTGFGMGMSAAGSWLLPANSVVYLIARHDIGSAQTVTATLTVEWLRSAA